MARHFSKPWDSCKKDSTFYPFVRIVMADFPVVKSALQTLRLAELCGPATIFSLIFKAFEASSASDWANSAQRQKAPPHCPAESA
jgi:hypothetical protein